MSESADEPLPEPVPSLVAGKTLGEVLLAIASSASIPFTLPRGVVRGLLPKHFRGTGEWEKWTVAAVYKEHEFGLLVGFMTPKGNKLSLYDWPDCQDREMLMAWRPKVQP